MTGQVEFGDVGEMVAFSTDKPRRCDIARSAQIMSQFACFEPGQDGVLHHHPAQDEVFFVIEGKGSFTAGDREIPVAQGSYIFVPAGVEHRARANAGSRLVIMFTKCTSAVARAAAASAEPG
ncbi:MAG: cupin domain-containing protein [Alphaproteobacteria bacterium]|nr:cupin domain-containing protein [Alphaproteobacteria bacterium]